MSDIFLSQIENGEAIPFTARATAPTVTMPRIKALTTGKTVLLSLIAGPKYPLTC